MKSLRLLAVGFASVCLLSIAAYAGDPTGAWKWTSQGRNGPQESTATLALKDGKLTGAVSGRGGDTPISNATFKDDAISFTVEREMQGNKFVIKYDGKLDGDSIKGSIERPGRDGGAPVKTDWAAARTK